MPTGRTNVWLVALLLDGAHTPVVAPPPVRHPGPFVRLMLIVNRMAGCPPQGGKRSRNSAPGHSLEQEQPQVPDASANRHMLYHFESESVFCSSAGISWRV